jgi:hypothetical protein
MHDALGIMDHQLKILMQQRLTLGAVGDHVLNLRIRFHMRREASASSADLACVSD